jgi:polysaccharide pyruvyl transferase CsaB
LRSLVYYAGIIRAAAKAYRKAMIFAQSIGPLDFWGRALVKECCKGLSAATVRDQRSLQMLSPLLPAETHVEQTADPVFLYDAPEEDVDLSAEGLGADTDPLVIVSVRKASGMKDRLDVIARAIDRLAQRHDARVAFLPIGGAPDAEVSTLVIRKCKTAPVLLPECTLERAANIIRRAKAVVGMRLHALILAGRYGVPFLAIPYDPKVTALCDDLEYPLPPLFTLNPPSPKPEFVAVDALVDDFWSRREALSAHLLGAGERLRQLAARNFEVLDELLAERRMSP